jgi:ketosteroid isomerase-like protein
MIRMRPVGLLFLLSACGAPTTLGPAEIAEVEAVMNSFRQAWLADDSATVMRHVSADVTMFVPGAGAPTLTGKEQLRAFWFPGGGKAYPIRKYENTNQTIYGAGTYAIAQGTSALGWDTTIRDSVISSSTSKSEYVTVLRKEDGQWRIFRNIFVVR